MEFSDWIEKQLKQRNWNSADLARGAGLDTGMVSRILNGLRKPSPETLTAFAKSLHLAPETVFRAAGLLPPEQELDPIDEELLNLFDQLDDEDQEELLALARMKLARREKNEKTTGIRKNSTATQR